MALFSWPMKTKQPFSTLNRNLKVGLCKKIHQCTLTFRRTCTEASIPLVCRTKLSTHSDSPLQVGYLQFALCCASYLKKNDGTVPRKIWWRLCYCKKFNICGLG